MKKSKFTEEQIVFALKEHQQGTKVNVITRKLGICSIGGKSNLVH